MKSLKYLSITGLALFGLLFLGVCADDEYDYEAMAGIAMIASLYGIALAIVALLKANKELKNQNNKSN